MKHWDFENLVTAMVMIAAAWTVLNIVTGGRAVHPLDTLARR